MGHLYTALYLLSRFTLVVLHERTNHVTFGVVSYRTNRFTWIYCINFNPLQSLTINLYKNINSIVFDEMNEPRDQIIQFKLYQIIKMDFHVVVYFTCFAK